MEDTPKPELTFREDLILVGTLTPQMLIFIAEYVNGAKVQDAAVKAGFAPSAGYRLIKLPEVMEQVLVERERQLRKLEVTDKKILDELAKIAFLDVRDFFRADGTPKEIEELGESMGAAISSIDVESIWGGPRGEKQVIGTVKKIRFHDKKGALELLGRYLKLWTDKIEVSGPQELAERLRKGRENAQKVLQEANAEPKTDRE